MQPSEAVLETFRHLFSFNHHRGRNAFAALSPCLRRKPDCTETCADYSAACDEAPPIRHQRHDSLGKLSIPVL